MPASTAQLLNHHSTLAIIAICRGVIGEGVLEMVLEVRKLFIEKFIVKLNFFFS